MSYNIDSVKTLRSTLRISRRKATKALKTIEHLPEGTSHMLEKLDFDVGSFALINEFHFYGEGSGNAYHEGALHKLVALTEGEADLIFTWEGGDSHSGLRIRDGKMTEVEVIMALAPEKG